MSPVSPPISPHGRKISVIGLGYVGLPVAVAFARGGASVIAFDINEARIDELANGEDRTNEVESADLKAANLQLCSDPATLAEADFHIVTVPTPIDKENNPDLSPILAASKTLGGILKRGDIVVYESTVYPGATEEDCIPVLEAVSGLRFGDGFTVGYSPERINPGDKEHRFETISKVVAGSDAATLDIVANVYGSVVTAGIHRAANLKTAEAAKVIENTQRDLNIALMNELAVICNKLDIDTRDVLEAAGTKWNFLPFVPGLVGGHCIGVDPYYLTHRAEKAGYHPQVILSGRRINDGMSSFVVQELEKPMLAAGIDKNAALVTVLGVTFKEDVPDVRNSKITDVIAKLQQSGMQVQVIDPVADPDEVNAEYGIKLTKHDRAEPADAVILGVGHREFADGGWIMISGLLKDGKGHVSDLKGMLDRETVPNNVTLWRL
jgi:UDP-N-acetyl-D-glucosamine/UDP-N-acetyl-D-galactosamine dehydrogenase